MRFLLLASLSALTGAVPVPVLMNTEMMTGDTDMTTSMGMDMVAEKPQEDSMMMMMMMGDDAMKRASMTKEEEGGMMVGTEMGMEVSKKRNMMMDAEKEKEMMMGTEMGMEMSKKREMTMDAEKEKEMMMGTEMGMVVSKKREMMMDAEKEKEMTMMKKKKKEMEKEMEMEGSMVDSKDKRDGTMEKGPMLEEQMGKSVMDAMKRDIKRMPMMDTLMGEGNTSKPSGSLGTQDGEMMGESDAVKVELEMYSLDVSRGYSKACMEDERGLDSPSVTKSDIHRAPGKSRHVWSGSAEEILVGDSWRGHVYWSCLGGCAVAILKVVDGEGYYWTVLVLVDGPEHCREEAGAGEGRRERCRGQRH
ncbi:hypothetical protein K505DRAFT_337983 [Melanomma pulvis-pyrius CBS 109.77]|uniref:Uncharacterized protein n=1 Tax=Melanomma pulvis-pyrius CBS 109.77 TaxID=1314802 RepID=A0A6A6XBY1_9PLEO|nr:hypothetical protein K505DRAFT_337983 [Melanomma pulvis-pyrius CBS 109.77]